MFVARFWIEVLASGLTLYMMAILLRWLAPWIELDVHAPRLRWLPRLTDPLINLMRRILPPMGPMDWGPIAAVISIWMVRLLLAGY